MHFFIVLPGLGILMHTCAQRFRRLFVEWRSGGPPVPEHLLWVNVLVGAIGLAYGLGTLLVQIHTWVWMGTNELLWLELTGILLVGGIFWIGILMRSYPNGPSP